MFKNVYFRRCISCNSIDRQELYRTKHREFFVDRRCRVGFRGGRSARIHSDRSTEKHETKTLDCRGGRKTRSPKFASPALTSGLQQQLGESPHSRPGHCSTGDHRVVPEGALPFALDRMQGRDGGGRDGLRVVSGRRLRAGRASRRTRRVGDGRLLRRRGGRRHRSRRV